jgi:methylated-DNA-[protein]-cysteine S-methyltransferase
MYYASVIDTPVGILMAIASDEYLVMLEFADSPWLEKKITKIAKSPFIIGTKGESTHTRIEQMLRTSSWQESTNKILQKTILQLEEYFTWKRRKFDIPLAPEGTDFQKKAWYALERIPYGETRSYKEEAILAGNPKAVRAIGWANNKNPIIIIIPCHRVIGSDGSLVWYGWGMDRKVWLLNHEQK